MKTAKLILTCSSLFLFGCKPAPPFLIDADIKQSFSFGTGTWWVYQDSATGLTDSFVVLHYNDSDYYYGGGKVSLDEILSDSAYLNGNPDSLSFNWRLGPTNKAFYSGINFPVSSQVFIPFQFPFQNFASAYDPRFPTDDQFSITPLQSYQVNGQTFDTVALVYYTDYDTTYNDWYYIAKGTGIIKIQLNHPTQKQTLNLLRYHIVR